MKNVKNFSLRFTFYGCDNRTVEMKSHQSGIRANYHKEAEHELGF